MEKRDRYIVSIDVGGTFTDVVAMQERDGATKVAKVPSTPHDPSVGFLHGIRHLTQEMKIPAEDISYIIHGSTVGCNAVVQGNLPKTVLLTTQGFRDELELARMVRSRIYDLAFSKPRLLIPRHLRYEVKERMNFKGEVIQKLTQEEIGKAVEFVRRSGAEAVAICFLFSYTNSTHEIQLREAIEKALPNCYICSSSDVNPTFREYERTCVTVLNAALRKTMAGYLSRIEHGLKELNCAARLYIMRQDGGVMGNLTAQEVPINALISGPTGGALMAAALGRQMHPNVISLDVGGTTADACVIREGEIQFTDNWEIGGYPLTIRSIEVNPIGAGGGSIAWVDEGGFLRVGPQSAGAYPGPLAYGNGGEYVTLTDANIALGRLSGDSLLDGTMELNTAAAQSGVKQFGAELGMSMTDAAEGIIKVAVANMAKGIRKISAERGLDLRDFALVPFGGGGPMYGSELARELGIRKVIIPRHPGTSSAHGLLTSDLKHVTQRSYVQKISSLDLEDFEQLVVQLKDGIRKIMYKEGHAENEVRFTSVVDIRYIGQSYEIPIAIELPVTKESLRKSAEDFHDQYKMRYGHCSPDKPIEIVNVHLSGFVSLNSPHMEKLSQGKGGEQAVCGTREIVFHSEPMLAKIYHREALGMGDCIHGPAIISEYDSTTVVWPEDVLVVDEYGNIILTWESDAE